MKRKLQIEELSITSFSTEENGALTKTRGTVQGLDGTVFTYGSCLVQTCDAYSCNGFGRTCALTCQNSCGGTCYDTCQFTCGDPCP